MGFIPSGSTPPLLYLSIDFRYIGPKVIANVMVNGYSVWNLDDKIWFGDHSQSGESGEYSPG